MSPTGQPGRKRHESDGPAPGESLDPRIWELRRMVLEALVQAGSNESEAAVVLRIRKRTLSLWMRHLGLKWPRRKARERDASASARLEAARRMKDAGVPVTKIAAELGYKHAESVHHLLKRASL